MKKELLFAVVGTALSVAIGFVIYKLVAKALGEEDELLSEETLGAVGPMRTMRATTCGYAGFKGCPSSFQNGTGGCAKCVACIGGLTTGSPGTVSYDGTYLYCNGEKMGGSGYDYLGYPTTGGRTPRKRMEKRVR